MTTVAELIDALEQIDDELNVTVSVDISTGEDNAHLRAFGNLLHGIHQSSEDAITVMFDGYSNEDLYTPQPIRISPEAARRIAEEIVLGIMVNKFGDPGNVLRLYDGDAYLGGWGREPTTDRITAIIERAGNAT